MVTVNGAHLHIFPLAVDARLASYSYLFDGVSEYLNVKMSD